MNKDELIEKLQARFFGVDKEGMDVNGKVLDGIKVWGIGVFDLTGDVITKKNLTFYTKDDTAYWGNFEPNPDVPTPELTFTDKVNAFIASKVADDTIKFGYILHISELTKRASVMARMPDNSEKEVLMSEGAQGKFILDQL